MFTTFSGATQTLGLPNYILGSLSRFQSTEVPKESRRKNL